MKNIQLERQAVTHKGILDFTIQRIPDLPESVKKRFPELTSTSEQFERLRQNLQLQLREQFVAIREMLERVVTIEKLETLRETLTVEIQKLDKEITVITQITEGSDPPPNASALVSGLVKTDKTVTDPVVYLASTVDELLAAIIPGGNITNIITQINFLNAQVINLLVDVASIQANFAPLMHFDRDPRILPVIAPVPAGGSTLAPIWGVLDLGSSPTFELFLWNGTEWIG